MEKKNGFVPGLILSVISAIMLWYSFTPKSVEVLAWVALVPLYVALLKFAGTKFQYGFFNAVTATVFVSMAVWKLPGGYEAAYALGPVIGIFVFLLSFWQKNLVAKNNYRFFTAITVPGMIIIEMTRQNSPVGQFCTMGLSQLHHPVNMQIALWFGTLGVTFLILLVNATIALLIANFSSPGKVKIQVAVNTIIIAVLIGCNYYIWNQPVKENGKVKVAVIQFGYVPELKKQPPSHAKFQKVYKKLDWHGASMETVRMLEPLTREAAAKGAKLVVWPECAVWSDPDKRADLMAALVKIVRENNIYLVLGVDYPDKKSEEKKDNPSTTNLAYVFTPKGEIVLRYIKRHRVTSANIEMGIKGDRSDVLKTSLGKLAVLICYDADHSDVAREYAEKGTELFVVPSHDLAGFLTKYHAYMANMRAVEHRKSLVKSDYVNGSVIVDYRGRILADPPDGLGYAIADVPLVESKTVQPGITRMFYILMIAVFAISLIVAITSKEAKGV